TRASTSTSSCAADAGAPAAPADTEAMADAPLLERLAALPPVPVSELIGIMAEPARLSRDPLFAGLVGVDDSGSAAVPPLVPAGLERLGQRADATCYGALIEALTGMWNAAVRGAVV